MMNLLELQNKIHAQNVDMGWWDNPRTFHALTNLGVSELSEAVEAHRKNLNDDKLTAYHGTPVEAVDGIIRTLDVLASMGNSRFEQSVFVDHVINKKGKGVDFLISFSSYLMLNAWEAKELFNDDNRAIASLRDALHVMFEIVYQYELDPIKLIIEKVEYNKHRADHKRENRAKPGGKSY